MAKRGQKLVHRVNTDNQSKWMKKEKNEKNRTANSTKKDHLCPSYPLYLVKKRQHPFHEHP